MPEFLEVAKVADIPDPGKQLLVETTLLKIRRELGGEPLGDTISTQTGGVRL